MRKTARVASFPTLPVVKMSEPVKMFRLARESSSVFSPHGNARIIYKTFNSSKSREIDEERGRLRGGNRFNDGTRGAWYCALDSNTAIAEVAYHWTRIIKDGYGYEPDADGVEIIFQELLARFVGLFHDARGLPRDKGVLGTEPDLAYPLARGLARKIIAKGGRGIIYPSVRRPKGVCLAAFYPQTVQKLQFGDRWKLSWNESLEYKAEKMEEEQKNPVPDVYPDGSYSWNDDFTDSIGISTT